MPIDKAAFLRNLPASLLHDMTAGGITLRAMSLVYTTLLSLVPLLALSFSVLKAFGVHNQMEPLLLNLMAPLGEKATELTQQVVGFVDNVKVGVLGTTGLVILLYTVVSLMQKVEEAFNHTWRVTRPRTLTEQARDYLSVILVGPILLFSALGLWTSVSDAAWMRTLTSIEPFGTLLALLIHYSPTLLIILAFTLIYLFIPNTKVKPYAALGGAAVAGVAWQVAGWGFASFVVSSGQQTAIYSIFASLFLFMLWLYLGWMIVLSGARLAYYFQHPDAVLLALQPAIPSLQTRELLAVGLLREIGGRFIHHQPPPTFQELRNTLPVSRFLLENVLDDLVAYGLVSRDDGEPAHYLLRIAPDTLTLGEIRRYFWRGDAAQRKQAEQVQNTLNISGDWLAAAGEHPHITLQKMLGNEYTQKTDES